jgi:hypothetical protein
MRWFSPTPACASDVTTFGMVEPKTEEFFL